MSEPAHVFRFSDAVFSDDGRYRYRLDRGWPGGVGRLPFVLLNPSKADKKKNDPTAGRCIGFAEGFGFNALTIVNLFAWCDRHPRGLLAALAAGFDPVGPDNDRHIREAVTGCPLAIVGCGAHPFLRKLLWPRLRQVLDLLTTCGVQPMCLGINQDGSPEHPLFLPANRVLQPYAIPA